LPRTRAWTLRFLTAIFFDLATANIVSGLAVYDNGADCLPGPTPLHFPTRNDRAMPPQYPNSSEEAIPMRIHRLYTGTDGQSHLEELKIPFAPGGMGEQAPMQKANGVVFSRVQPGAFMDWHNAPRRQFVITLQGAVEIGLGDGSVHRFGPGEGVLAEDLTGKGHTTRAVGNEPRITIAIPLAD
jgi:hypothetical protein